MGVMQSISNNSVMSNDTDPECLKQNYIVGRIDGKSITCDTKTGELHYWIELMDDNTKYSVSKADFDKCDVPYPYSTYIQFLVNGNKAQFIKECK